MPRFFFHVDGPERIEDGTGLELRNADEAVSLGEQAFSELIAENPSYAAEERRIEIRDEQGQILMCSTGVSAHQAVA